MILVLVEPSLEYLDDTGNTRVRECKINYGYRDSYRCRFLAQISFCSLRQARCLNSAHRLYEFPLECSLNFNILRAFGVRSSYIRDRSVPDVIFQKLVNGAEEDLKLLLKKF